MNHLAIRRAYPNAVTIYDSSGVFDGDGNQITIDQSLVNTAASAIQTELNWQNLRDKRNQLLSETDYLALSDVTMSSEMQTYRKHSGTCLLTPQIRQILFGLPSRRFNHGQVTSQQD